MGRCARDPEKQWLYVNANEMPWILTMVRSMKRQRMAQQPLGAPCTTDFVRYATDWIARGISENLPHTPRNRDKNERLSNGGSNEHGAGTHAILWLFE